MDFSKNDFSQARIGDKCYSIIDGEGYIESLCNVENRERPIRVRFGQTIDRQYTRTFTLQGRCDKEDIYPTLYHSTPHFEIPERPKRKVKKEVKVWAIITKDGEVYQLFKYQPAINNPDYGLLEFTKEIEIEE